MDYRDTIVTGNIPGLAFFFQNQRYRIMVNSRPRTSFRFFDSLPLVPRVGHCWISLSSEEAHHLDYFEEVDCEDNDMQSNVEHGTKFDMLASEHGGKMHRGGLIGQGRLGIETDFTLPN